MMPLLAERGTKKKSYSAKQTSVRHGVTETGICQQDMVIDVTLTKRRKNLP